MKGADVTVMETHDPFEEFPQMENIDAVLQRERSPLLSLPPEILQNILYHMDAPTCFVSLLSCTTIYEAAKTKRVLLRHLNRMPGLRLGLDSDLAALSLFESFRKRAAKSLCAAGVLANISKYVPNPDLTNITLSAISPGKPVLMATAHEHGEIHIYELSERYVRLKVALRTETELDQEFQYYMEVLRMTFSRDKDLAVLCRPRRPRYKPSPFGEDEECQSQEDTYRLKLITFHRCHAKTKGFFYSSDQQETREITCRPYAHPVGLALANNGNACIAWKSSQNTESTEVWLYGRDARLMEVQFYDPSPDTLLYTDPPPRNNEQVPNRLIYHPSFSTSDRTLNFYSPGQPIHYWYTNSCSPSARESGPIRSNHEWLDISEDEASVPFAVGIPFHGVHTANVTVSYTDNVMCRVSYLAIATSKDSEYDGVRESAFVVQCIVDSPPVMCTHSVHLEAGRRSSSWKPLALLAGYRQGTSSLGTIMAISPSSTHIAAATWTRVLIWSLDPTLLHQGGLEHYFPHVDYNVRKQLGRLRPVRLKPEGVVHKLCWVGDTTLYAVTDEGLVRWDCGHLSEGSREVLTLQYDAWAKTAVAMPLSDIRSSTRRGY